MRLVRRNAEKIKVFFISAILILSQMMVPILAVQPVRADEEPPEAQKKVTICHATDSNTNPYITNKPNTSGDVNGHDSHHTDAGNIIWFDGIQTKWDDIIPPFYYEEDNDIKHYEGKNWTDEGQAIYDNGCNLPGQSSLEVVKNLVPISDEGLFDIGIAGVESVEDVSHRGTTGPVSVEAGKYTVIESAGTETVLSDYTTVISCSTTDDVPKFIGSGTPDGEKTRQLTIDVAEGENVFCIITNTAIPDEPDTAKITITKYIDEDGDGQADRKADKDEWFFKLGTNEPVATNSEGQVIFEVEESDDYIVTELPKEGYEFFDGRGTNCKIDDSGVAGATVVVGEDGQDAECTFLNQKIQYGSITIEKMANPETDQAFEFKITNNDRSADFKLVDDGTDEINTKVFKELAAGSYTIQERVADGWELENIRCTGDDDIMISVDRYGVRITLDGDEDVKCYFINDRQPVTFVASKIVCTDESELPNWGNGGPDITNQTAIDWVDKYESCNFVEGWEFEWSFNGVGNPGDNEEYGGEGWNTFGPTDETGQTSVDVEDMGDFTRLWFREVFKDGYIPFTFGENDKSNSDDVSAEFYCRTDVLNYDNWDWIDNAQYGQQYYCVAWNVATEDLIVHKYEDLNADGRKNFGENAEPGLAEWEFTLYDSQGKEVMAQKTGPRGYTTFNDLVPGDYVVCETPQEGWHNSDPGTEKPCKKFTVDAETKNTINFGNYQDGKVLVNKYHDINMDGKKNFGDNPEQDLKDWTFRIYDDQNDQIGSDQTTGPNGWTTFKNLTPGEYSICEILPEGWSSSDLKYGDAYEGLYEGEVCRDVTVQSGETVNNFRFGNYQLYGDVKVTKFHDINENGYFDDDEPTLEGWEINLEKLEEPNDKVLLDELEIETDDNVLTQETDENGMTVFEDLMSWPTALYELSENEQEGWNQTNIYCNDQFVNGITVTSELARSQQYRLIGGDSRLVFVHPEETVECFVGNTYEPVISIEKSNNKPEATVVGDEVVYSITVSVPEESGCVYRESLHFYPALIEDEQISSLDFPKGYFMQNCETEEELAEHTLVGSFDIEECFFDEECEKPNLGEVTVTDLPPEGFVYMPGSWTANSDVRGDLKGSGITTEPGYSSPGQWYLTNAGSPFLVPGEVITLTYVAEIQADVTNGDYPDNAFVEGYTSQGEEIYGNLHFTGNDPFVGTLVTVVSVDETEQGFVLGTLQTTGNPAILSVFVGTIIAGGALVVSMSRRNKRWFKGLGKSATSLALALVLSFSMFGSVFASGYWTTNVSNPEAYTKSGVVNLDYQVSSTDAADTFEVTLLQNGTATVSQSVATPYGDSGRFGVTLTAEGTYTFQTSALNNNGGDSKLSSEVSVTYDKTAPVAPTYNGVTRDGNTYTLSFTAGTDASKVLVYASTQTEFAADASTLVGEVAATATSFVYVAPDDAQRYFAIQSVDEAGNLSPLVGDSVTTVTVTEGDTSGSQGDNSDTGNVDDSAATSESDVEGTSDQQSSDDDSSDSNEGLAFGLFALLAVLAAGGFYYYRQRSD